MWKRSRGEGVKAWYKGIGNGGSALGMRRAPTVGRRSPLVSPSLTILYLTERDEWRRAPEQPGPKAAPKYYDSTVKGEMRKVKSEREDWR